MLEYLDVKETTSLPRHFHRETTFTHRWFNNTCGFLPSQVLRPFYCSDHVRLTICGGRHIYGLIINDPYDLTPIEDAVQILKLMPFPDILPGNRSPTFGYNRALSLNFRLKPYLISYSWPNNDVDNYSLPPLWLHKEGPVNKQSLQSLLDDDSGRVIIIGAKFGVLKIWDFALIYNQSAI